MKEIINQVIHGKTHLHIGKAGITPQLLQQVEKLYRKRTVIKIKLLNLMEFSNVREAFQYFADITNSQIADIRGKTAVFVKKQQ